MRTAGAAFQQLVDIMAHLRGPNGCPWDREQTLESLRGFVLEETYEVLEAIDQTDIETLRGEIGDFLFEGVFLAQICADEGMFTIADSLKAITAKLIRRHPHIFDPGGRPLKTAGQVVRQWEQIKGQEQSEAGLRQSLLAGLPKALPSLLRAYEIGTRVAAVGFDWPRASDVVDKIEEEVSELRQAIIEERGSQRTSAASKPRERPSTHARDALSSVEARSRDHGAPASERIGGAGPPPPQSGFGEVSPEPAYSRARAKADGAKPAGLAEEEMGDLLFSIANLARKLGIEPESALRRANEKFTKRFAVLERRVRHQRRSLHDMTLEELEELWRQAKRERR